ncbi:MAG: hypothetical protein AAF939_10800 [Planctomycetota bacterium]
MIQSNHEFADKAIYLSLAKDLSPKFIEIQETELHSEHLRGWQVAGYNDFLSLRIIDDLKSLCDSELYKRHLPWLPATNIILLPFADSFEAFDVNGIEESTEDSPHLFCFVEIRFSRGCTETEDLSRNGYERVVEAFKAFQENNQIFTGSEHCLCTSLGAADLVALCRLNSATDIDNLHSKIDRIRSLKFADLKDYSDSLLFSSLDGHITAAVQATMSFRLSSYEFFCSPNFLKDEKKSKAVYTFKARVDCGHEEHFQHQLSGNCESVRFHNIKAQSTEAKEPESVGCPTNWESFSVSGQFHTISDLCWAWKNRWFDYEGGWRQRNVVETITFVGSQSFIEENSGDQLSGGKDQSVFNNKWKFDQKTWEKFRRTRESIVEFSRKYLGEVQRNELISCYDSFLSCFFRAELFGAAHDLAPFFFSLGELFGRTELWDAIFYPVTESAQHPDLLESIFRSKSNAAEFNADMQALISHLARCLRNRIENRSQKSELPPPDTLDYGACSLVNAYSVAFDLCARLVYTNPSSGKTGKTFVSSVGAGFDGVIVCREFFKSIRKHAAHESSDLTVPHLLGLDLSGRMILEPSICFAHCLHEITEMSGWVGEERNDYLRETINRWLLIEIKEIYFNVVVKDAKAKNKSTKLSTDTLAELDEFIDKFIPMAIHKQMPGISKGATVSKSLRAFLLKFEPVEFVDELCKAIGYACIKFGETEELLQRDSVRIPVYAHHLKVAFDEKDFYRLAKEVKELVREYVPDIGMWICLNHLCREKQTSNSERFRWVCRLFEGVLFASIYKSGGSGNERLFRTILLRWSLQAASVLDSDGWRDAIASYLAESSLKDEIPIDKLTEWLPKTEDFKNQFDPEKGLVSRLKKLKAYSENVKTPSDPTLVAVEDLSEMERAALEEFACAWRNNTVTDELRLVSSLAAMAEVSLQERLLRND